MLCDYGAEEEYNNEQYIFNNQNIQKEVFVVPYQLENQVSVESPNFDGQVLMPTFRAQSCIDGCR